MASRDARALTTASAIDRELLNPVEPSAYEEKLIEIVQCHRDLHVLAADAALEAKLVRPRALVRELASARGIRTAAQHDRMRNRVDLRAKSVERLVHLLEGRTTCRLEDSMAVSSAVGRQRRSHDTIDCHRVDVPNPVQGGLWRASPVLVPALESTVDTKPERPSRECELRDEPSPLSPRRASVPRRDGDIDRAR